MDSQWNLTPPSEEDDNVVVGVATNEKASSGDKFVEVPKVGASAIGSGDRSVEVPKVSASAIGSGDRSVEVPKVGASANGSGDQSFEVPKFGASANDSGDRSAEVPKVGASANDSGDPSVEVPKVGASAGDSRDESVDFQKFGTGANGSGDRSVVLPKLDAIPKDSGDKNVDLSNLGTGAKGSEDKSVGQPKPVQTAAMKDCDTDLQDKDLPIDENDSIDSQLAAHLEKTLFISKDKFLNTGMDAVVEYMKNKKQLQIVTMVGAGISTAAGIPDFRSPGFGIYHNLQKYNLPRPSAIFEMTYFQNNPEPFFLLAREMFPKDAYIPTKAHFFIRLLQDKGLLLRHYTQNIDNLDRETGITDNKLVEAHGSFYLSHCLQCKTEYSLEWLKEAIKTSSVPKCPPCGGVVKPDIIFFGESMPKKFFRNIKEDFTKCNLLIIMGSSLVVEPFASLATRVRKTCPRLMINLTNAGENVGMNFDSEEGGRDYLWLGPCDDGVTLLAQKLGWEKELNDLVSSYAPPTQK